LVLVSAGVVVPWSWVLESVTVGVTVGVSVVVEGLSVTGAGLVGAVSVLAV